MGGHRKLAHTLPQIVTFVMMVIVAAKEEDLPLCPTNIQFFPQKLPMHCRMPTNSDFPSFAGMMKMPNLPTGMPPQMPFQPSIFQSPPTDKQPAPIPFPIPSGPIPGGFPLPGPMPMPMPMPMMAPPGGPAHKLPVIVMPFYHPDPSFKKPGSRPRLPKRKPKRPKKKNSDTDASCDSDSDTDTDTDTDTQSSSDTNTDTSGDKSSDGGYWKGWKKGRKKDKHRRSHRSGRRSNSRHNLKNTYKQKKELLTPILQYVTKDGYVIFEKKITRNEASDWLKTSNTGDETPVNMNVVEGMNKDDQKFSNAGVENVNKSIDERNEDNKNDETTGQVPLHLRKHHQRRYHTLREMNNAP